MRRSTAALIILVPFYPILLLLFFLLGHYAPEVNKSKPKHGQRIKVSLKERPRAKKDALVKNRHQEPEIAPPMPKGKRLKELVKEPVTLPPDPQPIKRPEPITRQSVKRKEPPKPPSKSVSGPSKPTETVEQTPFPIVEKQARSQQEENLTKVPQKPESNKLYATLCKARQPEETSSQQKVTKMRNSLVNENIPHNLRVNTSNIIGFDLYPDGDISEVRFIDKSGFYILDDTTTETVEYAYNRYPRPEQKTLIRCKVGYYLRSC